MLVHTQPIDRVAALAAQTTLATGDLRQLRRFGRPSHIEFKNPDFVKYAESFGAKGHRVERAVDLVPILKQALAEDTVTIVDCPVDYSENMKLTKKLKELTAPV